MADHGEVRIEPDWMDRLRRWIRLGWQGHVDGREFGRSETGPRTVGEPAKGLVCLRTLPVRLFAHQLEAVERVLFVLGGRALLADEVGLGKTIEAGTVLKELLARGLVRRALILAPAGLVRQWDQELRHSLGLEACLHPREDHGWDGDEVVLTSLELARSPRHAPDVQRRPWDLVIVDEAHRLKNHRSAGFRLVAGLQKGYLLLITATPVQNDLSELYNLVSLLRPGQLGTPQGFRREFTAGPRTPRNGERLRRLVTEVMVRTRRHEAGVELPPRHVQGRACPFTADEARLYREILEWFRDVARSRQGGEARLLLAVLLREAASSPRACAATLARLAAASAAGEGPGAGDDGEARLRELARRARELARRSPGPKIRWLLRRAPRWRRAGPGHVILFTQFAATARAAAAWLGRAGLEVVLLHGGLDEQERQAAIQAFRSRRSVLVSTDVASEGHNLQFCARLVNLDLPWNPMRLEQRIGRIHRLGQRRAVQVVNLVVPGTIEEYVLALVYEKLGMFREVVGDLDDVVASVPGGLERRIASIAARARTEQELRDDLHRLGEALGRRLACAQRARQLSSLVLDGLPWEHPSLSEGAG